MEKYIAASGGIFLYENKRQIQSWLLSMGNPFQCSADSERISENDPQKYQKKDELPRFGFAIFSDNPEFLERHVPLAFLPSTLIPPSSVFHKFPAINP